MLCHGAGKIRVHMNLVPYSFDSFYFLKTNKKNRNKGRRITDGNKASLHTKNNKIYDSKIYDHLATGRLAHLRSGFWG